MDTNQTQPNTTDMDALHLTHAIALSESGGSNSKPNYNAKGASGEHGAYQWMPGNFEADAKAAGLNPNDFSPENQDKVAYHQIKEYKDKGYDPGQISSLWNSGSPNNWQNHSGTNKLGVKYDTPGYVKKVQQNYQQLKGTQGFNPTPYSQPTNGNTPPDNSVANLSNNPPSTDTSLGTELINRTHDAGQAISDTISGKQNIVSGLLQTVGAGAGALGDVVNKGIELIPGVKQVENLLGQGIGALAKTGAGQAVVKSITDFSKEHPELSKDIGAGFNIVTAIPIIRGLGVVGKLGMEAGSQALKGLAEKSFIKGAPDLIASTKAGARFLEQNPNVTKDMIDRRLVGDIKGGEYVTEDAIASSEKGVKVLNKEVTKILEQPQYAQVGQDGNSIAQEAISGYTNRFGKIREGFPNSRLTPSKIIANAKKLDPNNELLWDKFEAGQANWKEINKLKSALDGKVKTAFIQGVSLDAPEIATSKELGVGLSNAMRDALQTTIPETQQFFKEMSTQFNIQKALDFMNGKKVVPGGVAKFAGHLAGAGTGGVVGGMVGGAPGAMVGGMIGDRTAGTISNALGGRNMVQGVLKRTGNNALKLSKKELTGKLGGLFKGAVSQKLVGGNTNPNKK